MGYAYPKPIEAAGTFLLHLLGDAPEEPLEKPSGEGRRFAWPLNTARQD